MRVSLPAMEKKRRRRVLGGQRSVYQPRPMRGKSSVLQVVGDHLHRRAKAALAAEAARHGEHGSTPRAYLTPVYG